MKVIIDAYLPTNGVKEITVQSVGVTPTVLDRLTLLDRYGSSVQMDVGVLYSSLKALAASRNLNIQDYLAKLQTTETGE